MNVINAVKNVQTVSSYYHIIVMRNNNGVWTCTKGTN